MGRTTTPKYKMEMHTPGFYTTPMGWVVRNDGPATEAGLAKWMEKYIASLQPGGANDHLGAKHMPTYARLSLNTGSDAPVIAEWHLINHVFVVVTPLKKEGA